MEMQKRLFTKTTVLITMLTLAMILFGTNVEAASFSISAAKTSLTVGSSTTLTVKAVDCGGKFSITSSDSSIVGVSSSSEWIEDTSATFTLTAKKAGKATITVTATNVSDLAGDNDITGSKTVTITVTEASSNSSGKSSDATLKSITVGSKTYSSPSTDITVSSVSSTTSSIKISAVTNSSKASVSGTGTKDLVTGTNKFTITVKAENGDTKSYIVRITKLAEESTTPNVVENGSENDEDETQVEADGLRLKSLIIEGVELIPNFESNNFEYFAYVCDLDDLDISVIASQDDALIEITGDKGLVEGENIVIIKVTKDEEVVEYKITVTKTILINEETEEETPEQKVGFVGWIQDWWNKSGGEFLTFLPILGFWGTAIVFVVMLYWFTNESKYVSKHNRDVYAYENNCEGNNNSKNT